MADGEEISAKIREMALAGGFAAVGFAPAGLIRHPQRLQQWLASGYHAEMAYMEANLSKRLQPDLLVPDARSVICLAASYAPAGGEVDDRSDVFIARFARGRDYHKVLKRRCHTLMDQIREIEPSFEGRAFVDSAPVAERNLAAAASIGWIGKNGCLIVPSLGSYLVLCEIICNLALPAGSPLSPQCGDCEKCLQACPTGALLGDGLVDARKCLSYLTSEHRGSIDKKFWDKMGQRIFGCDTCQEVCPHNCNLRPGDTELLEGGSHITTAKLVEMLAWDQQQWDLATRGSTIRRAIFDMFLRNVIMAAGNAVRTAETETQNKQALRRELKNLRNRRADLNELIDWALG